MQKPRGTTGPSSSNEQQKPQQCETKLSDQSCCLFLMNFHFHFVSAAPPLLLSVRFSLLGKIFCQYHIYIHVEEARIPPGWSAVSQQSSYYPLKVTSLTSQLS